MVCDQEYGQKEDLAALDLWSPLVLLGFAAFAVAASQLGRLETGTRQEECYQDLLGSHLQVAGEGWSLYLLVEWLGVMKPQVNPYILVLTSLPQ